MKEKCENANTFLSILWSWRECNVMELGHFKLAKVEVEAFFFVCFFAKKHDAFGLRSIKKNFFFFFYQHEFPLNNAEV